jgi:hypothetical protein
MDADDLAAFRNTRRIRRSAWGPKGPALSKAGESAPKGDSPLTWRGEHQLPQWEASPSSGRTLCSAQSRQ